MNPNEQLNEQEPESLLGEAEGEPKFEHKVGLGFANRSITGGKGPGLVSERENES